MPGTFRYVGYGSPAYNGLAAVVEDAKADDPLAPVTVVVATRTVGHTLRHRLATGIDRGAGLANVRFLTLGDLAEELGGVACRAGGRRKASRPLLGAAARLALSRHHGFLAPVADQPTSESELVSLYEDVRQLGEDGTDVLRGLGGRRENELAGLLDDMRAVLAARSFDDADLADEAVRQVVGLDDSSLGNVIVYLPERVRERECRLLAALAGSSDVEALLGVVGDESADQSVVGTAAALEGAGFVGRGRAPQSRHTALGNDEPVGIDRRIFARNEEDEVRAVLRIVLEALASGTPASRIGVFYSSHPTYAAALQSALDETGIAWSGASGVGLNDAPAARLVSGLLELADGALGRRAVMAWARSAPVLGCDGKPIPLSDWERVSRLAGIIEGDATFWCRRLDELASDRRHLEAEDGAETETVGPAERFRRSRARSEVVACLSLADFISELDKFCDEARRAKSWPSLAAWARRVLARYLAQDSGDPKGSPEASIDAVLDELGALEILSAPVSVELFGRSLVAALQAAPSYLGQLSSGITTGNLQSAIGRDFDLAVVLGAVEGELPARPRSTPLVSSTDRHLLGLEAASPGAVVDRDRRRLLAVLSGAERSVVSWRERDSSDGRARIRSRFVAGDGDEHAAAGAVLASVASGDVPAVGATELVSASLVALGSARRDRRRSHFVTSCPELEIGAEVASSRARHRFDRFSGRVGTGTPLEEWASTGMAPTTLETYAECPFRYFLARELHCDVVEAPEEKLTIEARDRGSLAHEVLERFVTGIIDAEGAEALATAESSESLRSIADAAFDRAERFGRTGVPALWARRRRDLMRMLERERQQDEERRHRQGVTPLAVEWTFDSDAAPKIAFGGDRALSFHGMVDRIDRKAGGGLSVVDYKTGRSKPFAGIAKDPVDRGRHLQLAIYGLAAQLGFPDEAGAIRALYRFLDEDGVEVGIDLDTGVVARAEEVLTVIVDGIENGLFPFNPGEPEWTTFANCKWCDFDSVCPANRDDCWDTAARSVELQPYAALVDPPDEATGD